jgi:hypothetical protein
MVVSSSTWDYLEVINPNNSNEVILRLLIQVGLTTPSMVDINNMQRNGILASTWYCSEKMVNWEKQNELKARICKSLNAFTRL